MTSFFQYKISVLQTISVRDTVENTFTNTRIESEKQNEYVKKPVFKYKKLSDITFLTKQSLLICFCFIKGTWLSKCLNQS